MLEPGQPQTKKRKYGNQPAHQSLFTDVFGCRPLFCTIHLCDNFTMSRRGGGRARARRLTGDIRMGWSGRAPALPAADAGLGLSKSQGARPCPSQQAPQIAVIGIDIGKNSFHVVGHDKRGSIVLRQKWSRGQIEARLRQHAALSHRHGGMRRGASSRPQARCARARRPVDAGQVCSALCEGAEERLQAEAIAEGPAHLQQSA